MTFALNRYQFGLMSQLSEAYENPGDHRDGDEDEDDDLGEGERLKSQRVFGECEGVKGGILSTQNGDFIFDHHNDRNHHNN